MKDNITKALNEIEFIWNNLRGPINADQAYKKYLEFINTFKTLSVKDRMAAGILISEATSGFHVESPTFTSPSTFVLDY